jgi:hypothetical protein
MPKVLAIVLFVCLLAPLTAQERPPEMGTAYRMSVIALMGANALDAHSSWNKPETNPIYGNRFSWQSGLIKGGVTLAAILVERAILRKRPHWQKGFTAFNFAWASATVPAAVGNYGHRR